jgi:L-malate glycosyltransferase
MEAMNNRITVTFPVTDLSRDGAQRQLLELVKGLDKKKFTPIILTLNSGGSMEMDFRQIPGLEIISAEKKGKYDLFCLFRIFRKMRQIKPDVVQPFLTPATFFGILPALWCRTPVILVTERNASGRTDLGPGTRIYIRIEDFLTHFADWAIPNSEAGKNSLVRRGVSPKRIKVIYNGLNFKRLYTTPEKVQPIRFQFDIPLQSKVIGMMARLFPIKNHTAFFKMAEIVARALPSAHFALLGDGPLRNEMEDLVSKSTLRLKTTFFGEQQDIGTFLSIFDIAVLTSDAEGCSNSLLEAMAMGKPVVATDVGGNREVVISGETGFLVPAGDIQAMANKIILLLQNPEKAQAMGQKARQIAISRFSIEKMVHEYESIYETTLRQKTRIKRRELVTNDQ